MIRYRRYRVFLIFSFFVIATIYRFTTRQEWESATTSSVERIKQYAGQSYKGKTEESESAPIQSPNQEQDQKAAPTPDSTLLADKVAAAIPVITPKPVGDWLLGSTTTSQSSTESSSSTPETRTSSIPVKNFGLTGQGRLDNSPPLQDQLEIHWEHLPEHFPIPKDRLITLPSGKPVSIPEIQYKFKDESATEKADREKKQAQIRSAFQHSWKGYKDNAWLHDELKPVSGSNRDTFCGWGATLVDALDTLWIMGLKDEFEEAVNALEQIDFTTTTRTDIPLFETVIRYLGGLLGAYDVSGGKYDILLTKAHQLGDILFAAFDTPNRMPITYYNWRPTFAKNPHRAGTRTVLAELGSLSMEFTRLAQLTGLDKYYDAVARITNELEIMQSNTRVPGLWPLSIDTSGCQKPHSPSPQEAVQQAMTNEGRVGSSKYGAVRLDNRDVSSGGLQKRQLDTDNTGAKEVSQQSKMSSTESSTETETSTKSSMTEKKTSAAEIEKPLTGEVKTETDKTEVEKVTNKVEPETVPSTAEGKIANPIVDTLPGRPSPSAQPLEKVDCVAQGLTAPPNSWSETYTFGGAADSVYEYLPKMYLLTGGLVPQYEKMYTKAIDAANKYLLLRPMIPDKDREIMLVGKAEVREGWQEYPENNFTLTAEQTHLLCFTGGMWGIGGKIFNREEDIPIAKKITDGCVWSYENTASGIMPEKMTMIACPDQKKCSWNETLWQEAIDPYWEQREKERIRYQKQMDTEAARENGATYMPPKVDAEQGPEARAVKQPTEGPLAKRQSGVESPSPGISGDDAAIVVMPSVPTELKNPYPTHEEYVEQYLNSSRLPKGVPAMYQRQYILRPEAIESVFIMYRMTGDDSWRQKGWKMWEAIERETKSEYGHSAIRDVTRQELEGNHNDEMESFWLAETLKYFYLLFSTPDTVSLDNWVLNTEAHPFKRPQ